MGMQVVLLMMKIWVLLIALSVHGSAELVESRRGHEKLIAAAPEKSPRSSWPTSHSPTKAPFPHKLMRPTSIAVAPSTPSLNGHSKKWHHNSASSPLASYYKHHHARNRLRSSAPEPSHKLPPTFSPRGSSSSPSQAPFPSLLAPAPSPRILSRRIHMPIASPTISPLSPSLKKARIPPPPPFLTLPPPPPNEDCASVTCPEPLTYAPPGLHCGCVWPIQVKLHLSIELYTFFPLVSELAKEIAASLSLNHSQVRIMGANEAKQELDKTAVLINLVPLGEKFNDATASFTYKKFWHRQVSINTSLFGAYDVLYVRYPGLPPSPPSKPSSISSMDGGAYRSSSNGENGGTIKPIGVDVRRVKKDGEKDGMSKSMIAVVVLSSFTAFVICVGVSWLLLLNFGACARKLEQMPHTLLSPPAKPSGGSMKPTISGNKTSSASISFGSSTLTYTGSAKTFTFSDIERATSSFEASRIVGEGGFGVVYRGILDDGREVAVKVLKREDQHGGREFLAEVEMLSRLHHRNLVKLIGICIEGHIRCLVYELVHNGSVESHLHGADKETGPLDWDARVKIALGAARGLAYLHEDSSPRVIHRDFKSSNILLEHDFTPKVSDFGLARAAHDEGNIHISTRVMGTFGYLAPEYAMTGHLLVKSDVYSYGVVLLELLTGRKPVDLTQPPGQENLVAWAHPLLTSKESLETITDPAIKPNPISFESVIKVAAIASMCVQPEVSNRPFMGEVVQALQLVCSEYEERVEHETRSQKDLCKIDHNVDGNVGAEMGLSGSFLLSASKDGIKGTETESFGSSRRHSSSSPLGTGRKKRQFWERLRPGSQ